MFQSPVILSEKTHPEGEVKEDKVDDDESVDDEEDEDDDDSMTGSEEDESEKRGPDPGRPKDETLESKRVTQNLFKD